VILTKINRKNDSFISAFTRNKKNRDIKSLKNDKRFGIVKTFEVFNLYQTSGYHEDEQCRLVFHLLLR
jgi:hypothetical protein